MFYANQIDSILEFHTLLVWITDLRTDACPQSLCIYTEIWDSTAAYKNGLEHEIKFFPNQKKIITFILFSADAKIFSNKFKICPWKHEKSRTKNWPGCPLLACLLICGMNVWASNENILPWKQESNFKNYLIPLYSYSYKNIDLVQE